jgi:hypothetical protein
MRLTFRDLRVLVLREGRFPEDRVRHNCPKSMSKIENRHTQLIYYDKREGHLTAPGGGLTEEDVTPERAGAEQPEDTEEGHRAPPRARHTL